MPRLTYLLGVKSVTREGWSRASRPRMTASSSSRSPPTSGSSSSASKVADPSAACRTNLHWPCFFFPFASLKRRKCGAGIFIEWLSAPGGRVGKVTDSFRLSAAFPQPEYFDAKRSLCSVGNESSIVVRPPHLDNLFRRGFRQSAMARAPNSTRIAHDPVKVATLCVAEFVGILAVTCCRGRTSHEVGHGPVRNAV